MDVSTTLIGIAWAAIFVMLAAGAVRGVVRLYLERPRLPFFAMLERRGLSYAEVELAVGAEGLALAMRRCGECGGRWDCGARPIACPNEPVFSAAASRKTAALKA